MEYILPDYVIKCLDTIENAGFSAYLVGGCVRDMMMGKVPHDYDITSSSPPEKTKSLFSHTADTGIKHGTITVIIDGSPLEVTQMRVDGEYTDHRHPKSIIPALRLSDDLKRRDFTINAMAMDKSGKITDICGGKSDLKDGIIRAVGDPDLRFSEDALRIMRAFRFSSQLSFNIEQKTYESAIKNAHLLSNISRERIYSELSKLLCGECPSAISPLIDASALRIIGLEKIDKPQALQAVKNDLSQRLSALIILCGADEMGVCAALKCSNLIKNKVTSLCRLYREFEPVCDKLLLKRLISQYSADVVAAYIELCGALKHKDYSDVSALLGECLSEPIFISELKIDGNELKKYGFSGGEIGCVLRALQEHIWANPTDNEKSKLYDIAKRLKP